MIVRVTHASHGYYVLNLKEEYRMVTVGLTTALALLGLASASIGLKGSTSGL